MNPVKMSSIVTNGTKPVKIETRHSEERVAAIKTMVAVEFIFGFGGFD